MTDVKVAVLLARLSNVLEGARLHATVGYDLGAAGADIERAQKLVEQIRGEL